MIKQKYETDVVWVMSILVKMPHPFWGKINSVRINIVFMQNGLIKTLQEEQPLLSLLTLSAVKVLNYTRTDVGYFSQTNFYGLWSC